MTFFSALRMRLWSEWGYACLTNRRYRYGNWSVSMKYLFLMNIGPVQDFIASARRTRDLPFGSWFFSELARAAACEIVERNELSSLIFAAPASKELLDPKTTTCTVPNKLNA